MPTRSCSRAKGPRPGFGPECRVYPALANGLPAFRATYKGRSARQGATVVERLFPTRASARAWLAAKALGKARD